MVNINYENGIMNQGDITRLKKTMAKAMKGDGIKVGFLGGSITQGSLSSTPETCYAYLVYSWFKEKFPKSEVVYINAGIGGTPSDFAVSRVDDDLLKYNPDFTIVEFSVNDASTDYYKETYEGLVRHILKDKSETALMLLLNTRYDNCESAEDKHLLVGKYYNLPVVSIKYSVYPEVANGNIKNRDITPDDLHPNDKGHALLAGAVTYFLDKVYATVKEKDADSKVTVNLPKPLTKNQYENSVRLQHTNFKPEGHGFVGDDTPQNHITEMFRHGFTAWKEGDTASFKTECSCISVQFRKSVNKPTPIAKAVVDGNEENAVILDGNFDEDWGDCLYTQPVLLGGELKEHKVDITIIKDHSKEEKGDVVPFYLVSVIAAH